MSKLAKIDPYIIFLAFLTAVPASATDMLLSAIPTIAKEWSVPASKVSLSISLFFLSLSIGLLIYGPLSDKYGRKPVLIFSTTSFLLTSYLCSVAISIDQFLFFRVLQGLSASGASTMSMAISRDKYDGKHRQVVLAYVGMTMAIVPMIAPTIGAYILSHFKWQVIFYAISIFSFIPLLGALAMKETNKELSSESLIKTVLRYKHVLLNKNYIKALLVLITSAGPFFAFIAFSPIAYISYFNLDEKIFGYLFALNASSAILGGLTVARLVKKIKDRSIITFFCTTGATAGLLIIIFGNTHYIVFALLMTVFTFSLSIIRPLANAVVLEQVQKDIGIAASLMLFYQFMIAAIFMSIATVSWRNPIQCYGYLSFVTMLILSISWIKTSKSYSNENH